MNKKKILSLALVLLLICTISFGTLAWFNDNDEVTNTFKVASSDDPRDPDDIFSVDVWEKVDKDGDGQPDEVGKDSDGGGHTYEKILPGDKLYKEPFIENTGAYDQYIRVHVTATDASEWETMLKEYNITDLADLFDGFDENLWIRLDAPKTVDNKITYTYYLQQKLAPDNSVSLFTHVVIPGELTQENLAQVGGSFDLTIVAEAVQTENVGDNALEAFKTVYGE